MPDLRATYRLQLTPDFGFPAAARVVPYLRALGISHLYLSPSLQARHGSTHGYDVTDPTKVSEDLGGERELRRLGATAAEAGMGMILDIVPNHMAADDENPWWADPEQRARVFDYDAATGWYRRFFDVDGLAGVRQEDPEVFEFTHAKVFDLVDQGLFDGLRVDHPDGLADPAGYLQRLAEHGVGDVWVEKILHEGEALRPWPVAGTTGYEFLVDATTVFVDPDGEPAITDTYVELTGDTRPFAEVAHEARLEQASTTFAREVERLVRLASGIGGVDTTTIADALARLPIYRTYVDPRSGLVEPADRDAIERSGVGDALARVLLLDDRGHDELVTRFQQTSPAVVAKGVEDTASYRSTRLLALNEVGGDPARFAMSVDDFHSANAARLDHFPRNLLAATTHDTKRSADVRARLGALAGMAEEFSVHVRRWYELTEGFVDDGAPSPAERWPIFQTLLGAWPFTTDRIEAYLEKALREAKVTTSWADPDLGWEKRVKEFARSLLTDTAFLSDFRPFSERVAWAGEQSSIGQTLLRLTSPGVPDTYQGDELWFLGLVDPDNRRPLDWPTMRRSLDRVRSGRPPTRATRKLHLIHHALQIRHRRPATFAEGAYVPLDAGPDTIAFLRGDDVLVIVPLRSSHSAHVDLPIGSWFDPLTGKTVGLRRRMTVAELTHERGVALLVRI